MLLQYADALGVISWAIVGAFTGACLGSFASVLAYRLPRGLSIILPRSHCPACQTPLRARDLVPIFSYLLNRGRCRFCGIRMGRRYLLLELGMAATGAASFALLGQSWSLLPIMTAATALAAWRASNSH